MLIDSELTYAVIGNCMRVHNRLGFGFAENVYVGALAHECGKRGLRVEREVPLAVHYDGVVVGTYRVDLLLEGRLIVEVKSCRREPQHELQLLNYLRCTDVEVGLLIYFNRRLEYRRFVFRNALKQHLHLTQ